LKNDASIHTCNRNNHRIPAIRLPLIKGPPTARNIEPIDTTESVDENEEKVEISHMLMREMARILVGSFLLE